MLIDLNKQSKIWAILIFLLLATFSPVQIEVSGRTLFHITELAVLAPLIILFILRKSIRYPRPLNNITLIILLVISLYAIIGFIFQNDIGEIIGPYRKLLIDPILACVLGYTLGHQKNENTYLDKALDIYTILLFIIGVTYILWGQTFGQEYGYVPRLGGIIVSIVLYRELISYLNNKQKRLTVAKIIFVIVLIFFTSARGIYVGVLVGLSVLGFKYFSFRLSIKTTLKYVGILLVNVMILYSVISRNASVSGKVVKLYMDFNTFYTDDYGVSGAEWNNVALRYYLYQDALATVAENPILGHGIAFNPGSFWLGGLWQMEFDHTPHNYYIYLLLKFGIVGLALFLIYIYNILSMLHNTKNDQVYSLFLFAVTMYIYASLDVFLMSNYSAIIIFYFLVGLGLAFRKKESFVKERS